MKKKLVLLLSLLLCVSAKAAETEKLPLGVLPPDACGVWCWYSYGGTPSKWSGKITADETYAGLKGIPIVVGWDKLEPEDGVYKWELFDDIIKKAAANNKYVFTLLWINPTEPQWLYDKGVPKVIIDSFKSDPNFGIQAYPMDKKYKFYSERIITKLAEHLRSLPPELFKRVVFHQVVEGSTGDGFCYKGEPTDSRYKVTREEWADYQKYIRRFTIDAFSKPMDGKPPMALLIHCDAEEVAWGVEQYPGIVLKQGVPSHGYGSNTERTKYNGYKKWMTPDSPAGRPIFSRGEGETMTGSKWFMQDPQQNMYWTALGALQHGLDIWNLPEKVIEDPMWRQSIDIFNKYAGQKYPSKSPVAFCALRDELNADDTVRFPEDKYGAANKTNTDRVKKICAEYAGHGAVVQDLKASLAAGLQSRRRSGYNDVAWDRIDEDYCRFLYPIAKLETSVGWWNLGPKDQPYGRFARGFEHKTGKDALYFGFHKDFFKQDGKPVGPLTFRVVWLDNTTGTWAFSYDAGIYKSVLIGWASATNSEIATPGLVWIKKNATLKGMYTSGFTNTVTLESSPYSDPGAGLVLPLDGSTPVATGMVFLANAGLDTTLSNLVTLEIFNGKNKFRDAQAKQYKLALGVVPKTGKLVGAFQSTNGVAKAKFAGVVMTNQYAGFGYFRAISPALGTNTGSFSVEAP